MLSHVTFTGWDRHTDLDELTAFLTDCPQETVEIAVLYSASRSADDEDRYPNVAKAAEILRTAKAAGQRSAVHLCGRVAREMLERVATRPVSVSIPGTISQMINLADRVQVNVPENFWSVDGPERYRSAATAAYALGRPVILQSRDLERWPEVEHFWPRSSRMVPFLFDRSAGEGVEIIGYPDPPPGRLVGYAGGIGPDDAAELVAKLASYPGARFWIDMESRIRERFTLRDRRPDGRPPATYVSIVKCSRVMSAVGRYLG